MKKYEILNADDRIEFKSIFQTLNDCFGTNYSGWMKTTWPKYSGNGNFRAWFPKLAAEKDGKKQAAAFDCVNTISDDWNEIVFDDLKNIQINEDDKYIGKDLVFAREPNNGPILFRGVYEKDTEKSRNNHHVSKRIATKVRIIGDPAYDIELLDSIDYKPLANNINKPLKPDMIKEENGHIIIKCGNCKYEFFSAPRCPECGQLVDMEDLHE